MNIEDYAERLRQLKKSIQDIKVHNRKLMEQEDKRDGQSSSSSLMSRKPKVYSMHDDEDDDEEKRSSDEQSDMRTNLFSYTVQDFIDWEKKQEGKRKHKEGSSGSGSRRRLQYLAKRSYDKDLEATLQKQEQSGLSGSQGKKETQFKIHKNTGKVHLQDDKRLVDQLAQNLIQTSEKRYASKRKEMETKDNSSQGTNYVNDKNKQFNESLSKRWS